MGFTGTLRSMRRHCGRMEIELLVAGCADGREEVMLVWGSGHAFLNKRLYLKC